VAELNSERSCSIAISTSVVLVDIDQIPGVKSVMVLPYSTTDLQISMADESTSPRDSICDYRKSDGARISVKTLESRCSRCCLVAGSFDPGSPDLMNYQDEKPCCLFQPVVKTSLSVDAS
jgi:hypothetical protein